MKFGIAADRLGYHEAWISEHLGAWFPDTVAHADLLIANAAGLTRQIKLGLAVRLLPLFHPMDVAISAAMCDHLLRGRYLLGVGTGVPFLGNMERRGLTNEMRHAMMMESLDCILTCWTSPGPFDWSSEHWPGTGISVSPAPYRKPHPPIAVATSRPVVVRLAAERGWILMVGQFDAPEAIRARADAYVAAARAAGAKADRNKVTVARHVHVSDSVKKARAELRRDVGRSLEQWKQRDPGRFRGFLPASGRVEDVTSIKRSRAACSSAATRIPSIISSRTSMIAREASVPYCWSWGRTGVRPEADGGRSSCSCARSRRDSRGSTPTGRAGRSLLRTPRSTTRH